MASNKKSKKKQKKQLLGTLDVLEAAVPEDRVQNRLGRTWVRITVALSRKEKLLFTKYFGVLLKSGVAIDEALKILMTRSKGSVKKVLNVLYSTVRDGETLASGFQKFPWIFGTVYINLIRAGEESGTLIKSLDQLLLQMKKDTELRKKIQGAMLYPAMILIAAVGISVGITIFVVPNVVGIFHSLDAELPLATRILLWVSETIQDHGLLVLLTIVLLIIIFFLAKKIPFVKPITHFLLLKTPVLGDVVQKVNLARITRLLGTLIRSGIVIDQAIPITNEIVKNVRYKKMLNEVKMKVSEGVGFAEALSPYTHLVPAIPMQVVNVGEQTGALDEMLIYLADFYDDEVSDVMRTLTTLIEPILMIFIGLLVGGIALAILTPIYSIVGQL